MNKTSKEDFLESITLELRPRLRSCIVFIFIGNKNPLSTRVKITENSIILTLEDKSKNLVLPTVKLLPTSLSSLRVTNKWISFRVTTKPETIFGTFKTEIISEITRDVMTESLNKLDLPPIGSECSLRCKCCENVISNIINCKRVLPLPDRDCDPGEWFCCKNSKVDFLKLLRPQETDYFYGASFCLLHNSVMKNLKEKDNIILCKRCLTILGTKEDSDSIKIWNCCVEQKIGEEEFKSKSQSPLDEFVLTIKDCSDVMGEEILLEAQEGNNTHYILMKPMEWQLELLTESNLKWESEAIRLQKNQVIKVFYTYGENVKSVKNDYVHSKYYLIALPLMLAGIEHLISSTKRFPPAYRMVAQYYVGYVNVQRSLTGKI